MNEASIKPISGVRPSETSAPVKPLVPSQPEGIAVQKPTASEQDTAVKPVEMDSGQNGGPANVSIHFRLDDKTNELTVFVVDRKTKRVIRSIPANELHKLQAGELLKLTA
jgi:hypothetical protein